MQGRRKTNQATTGVWSELLERDRESAAQTVPHFLYRQSTGIAEPHEDYPDAAQPYRSEQWQTHQGPIPRHAPPGPPPHDGSSIMDQQDHQPSRHAPPSWAKDYYNDDNKPIIRGLAIAGVLVLASGIGFGVMALQLSENDNPQARPAVSSLAAQPTLKIQPVKPASPAKPPAPDVSARAPEVHNVARTKKSVPAPQAAAAASIKPVAVAPPSNIGSGEPPLPQHPAVGEPVQITPQRLIIEPAARQVTTSRNFATAPSGQQPLPASETALLMRQRGDDVLVQGDVAGARAFFRKALQLGDITSAGRIGRTYDPAVFAEIGVRGMRPNPRLAERWYQHAIKAGDTATRSDLERLVAYLKK